MRSARRDPTTTINMIIKSSTRPKPTPAVSVEKHKQLEKQFSDLQQQWLQQNKQPPQPSPPSSSSSTSSTTTSEHPFQTLFHNSPRSLVSSLQKGKLMVSPDGWQRRRISANISTEDILTERKAAIESGIIKGRRRLFDDEEEICSSNNVDQEIQIHHREEEEEEDIGCSCRCRWCCRVSASHDHVKEQVFAYSEDEKKVWEVKSEKGLEVNINGGCKKMRKTMVPLLGWFSVSILVLVMGILLYKVIQIVAAAYDEIGHQTVVTLAPT